MKFVNTLKKYQQPQKMSSNMSLFTVLLLLSLLSVMYVVSSVEGTLNPVLYDGIVFNKFLPLLIEVTGNMGVLIQLRTIKLLSQSRYEALCIYHPTCKGYYLNGSIRRPGIEHTTFNRNVAMAYAMHKLIRDLAPEYKTDTDAILVSLGLDPSNLSQSLSTPQGVGNYVASKMMTEYHNDGTNQLGNMGPRGSIVEYNRMNYSDYTQYEPKNQHFKIRDPDAWQPLYLAAKVGGKTKPVSQTYFGAQFAHMKTFADLRDLRANPQVDRWDERPHEYKKKTQYVMKMQRELTDLQKLTCEFFDNKALGFRLIGDHIVHTIGNNSLEFHTVFNMLVNTAAGDSFQPLWAEKTRFDAVRPFTSVHFLYGNKTIKGWGGPGKGVVSLKGREWQSYLPTDFFSDFPSGTSGFTTSWVQAAKLFLGINNINFRYTIPAGASMIEPGFTPRIDTTISFPTLDDIAEQGPFSRVLAGVHFVQSTQEGARLGKIIGTRTYNKFMQYYAGH